MEKGTNLFALFVRQNGENLSPRKHDYSLFERLADGIRLLEKVVPSEFKD